jgi:hypothetical protein
MESKLDGNEDLEILRIATSLVGNNLELANTFRIRNSTRCD